MIYDCPACAAALRYNPSLGKMVCLSCGNIFDLDEVTDSEEAIREITQEATKKTAQENADVSEDTMECNIYSCTACGAELAVNGVESSTFCAYCGQPTIVFNRVSSTVKPKYIIPFSVSKNQAISAIRSKLTGGYFVPDEIKNFEMERIRGIYVPYWLFDVDYHDSQYLKGDVGSGKNRKTKYFYREAECSFRRLTLDASIQLSDASSQRLEPYNTSAMRPFEVGYLSGFYADRYDAKSKDLNYLAVSRAKEYFDKEVIKTVKASNVSIIRSHPLTNVLNAEYAMFPAWFLTFRYQGEPYTILVNGQTGKVIGAVPYEQRKVNMFVLVFGIVASLFINPIMQNFLMRNDSGEFVLVVIIAAIMMALCGHNTFHKVKTSIALSKSSLMNHFVKDRQEGE